jgi:hypothetical protein
VPPSNGTQTSRRGAARASAAGDKFAQARARIDKLVCRRGGKRSKCPQFATSKLHRAARQSRPPTRRRITRAAHNVDGDCIANTDRKAR